MNRTTTQQNFKKVFQSDSFKEGALFEDYIRRLFNERSFHLKKWRKSEKFADNIFLPDHSYPDLEMIFEGKGKHRFAVECKWRKKFKEGKIKWADDSQIAIYQKYQKEFNIPVFIAIGIGGEASNPEKLFVTPLRNIDSHRDVYESDLLLYKRKPANKFFYDTVQLKLF